MKFKMVPITNFQDTIGVSVRKRDQIDKKFFFEITNILDQMIKSTSILLRNFFLKKISIWSLFPALTPIVRAKDTWSIIFQKDFCRIEPANMSGEERAFRNKYT